MGPTSPARSTHRRFKGLLLVGYLSLAWGILAARGDPANGYEVSIYTATTLGFWIGVGIALLVAVMAVVYLGRGRIAMLGVFLAGIALTAVVALPLVRGYRFYGLADSLTHLGWARLMATGGMSPFELLYPGGHLTAVLIAAASGLTVARAMMLVVVACHVAFFVFVPLTLKVLNDDRMLMAVGGISAVLLLPLNHIGVHQMFHSYSLVTLLFPFVLYLLFKHTTGDAEDGVLPTVTSAAGLVLPLVTAAVLLIHPQPTLNILIFFATVSTVQWGYRRFRPDHPISRYRAIYGQTAFLALLFFAWNVHHWQMYSMFDGVVNAVTATIQGTGTSGEIVTERTGQAAELGVGVGEMFVKLFLVSAIYVVLSAGLVLAKVFRALRRDHSDSQVAIAYFAFGGVTLGPFFLVHYLGRLSNYFFRHLGFVMVFATILGAIALQPALQSVAARGRTLLRPIAALAVVAMLLLSLFVVYPSPYIYKSNHHVSEQLLEGYGDTFAHAPAGEDDSVATIEYVDFLTGPDRFADAHGFVDTEYAGTVPELGLGTDLVDYYAARAGPNGDTDFYLPITDRARQYQLRTLNGHRYPSRSFAAVDRQPGVHRIRSNGGFTLYYIETSFGGISD